MFFFEYLIEPGRRHRFSVPLQLFSSELPLHNRLVPLFVVGKKV